MKSGLQSLDPANEVEGLFVIKTEVLQVEEVLLDTPQSILGCTNSTYYMECKIWTDMSCSDEQGQRGH